MKQLWKEIWSKFLILLSKRSALLRIISRANEHRILHFFSSIYNHYRPSILWSFSAAMVAPIDLSPHRHRIELMHTAGCTNAQIVETLNEEGIECKQRTLKRRLQVWGLKRLRRIDNILDEGAKAYILSLFYQGQATDEEIRILLQARNIILSLFALRRFRYKHGLRRRRAL